MLINAGTLRTLYIGYNAAFQSGIGQAPSQYERICMTVTAATKSIDYGMLGKIPSVRKWIGPRQINALGAYKYSIDEFPWEDTIEVDRDDIETDNIGIYTPMFQEFGLATGGHYDELAFATLKQGFATPCYDKQYFFDTDHPVLDANGATVSVANTDGGGGTPWFLIDTTRAIKPLILQRRRGWGNLIRKDKEDDDNVFFNKTFIYGADARYNIGFGLWQYAWGSKQTLDVDHYTTARAAMMGMKGDYGRPIGVMPNLLVVPPSLEKQAREILKVARLANGADNAWQGTADVLVVPWLA